MGERGSECGRVSVSMSKKVPVGLESWRGRRVGYTCAHNFRPRSPVGSEKDSQEALAQRPHTLTHTKPECMRALAALKGNTQTRTRTHTLGLPQLLDVGLCSEVAPLVLGAVVHNKLPLFGRRVRLILLPLPAGKSGVAPEQG